MRDGWNDDEKTVINDAREAGINSPMIFGYLPRLPEVHEPLRLGRRRDDEVDREASAARERRRDERDHPHARDLR